MAPYEESGALNKHAAPNSTTFDAAVDTLRTQRNAFTPLCRLPNEILIKIMRELQYQSLMPKTRFHHEWLLGSWSIPDPGQWMPFTFVCLRTRQLAVNTPLLWRVLDLDNPMTMKHYIDRIPLAVHVYGNRFLSGDFEALMDPLKGRVRRFSVVVGWAPPHDSGPVGRLSTINGAMLHDMTNLEDLEIKGSFHTPMTISHFIDSSASMNLTTLKVADIPLPTSLHLPRLIGLEWYFGGSPEDPLCLMQIFTHSPLLRHVHIIHRRQNTTYSTFLRDWIGVKLPYLRTLTIAGPIYMVEMALCILPDPSEQLILSVDQHNNRRLDTGTLFEERIHRRIRHFMTPMDSAGILDIMGLIPSEFHIDYGPRSGQHSEPQLYVDTSLRRTSGLSMSGIRLGVVLFAIQHLQVHTVVVNTSAAQVIFPYLRSHSGAHPLPNVKRVEFSNAPPLLLDKQWREHFIAWLGHRARVGLRLESLVIKGLLRRSKSVKEIRDSGLVDNIWT
jgi:hypothetical protein